MKNRLTIMEASKVMQQKKQVESELQNCNNRLVHDKALTARQFFWTGFIIWGVLLSIGISLSLWINGWQALLEIHYAVLIGTWYNLPIIIILMALISVYNMLRICWNKRKRKKYISIRHRLEVLDTKLQYSVVPSSLLNRNCLGQMVEMKKEAGTPDEEIIHLFENFVENEKSDETISKQKRNNVIYLDSAK